MDILTLKNVSKSFGARQVVKNISFSVPEHSVLGFIGKNGAGKTTTMKMILGLIKMDEGEIRVCDEKVTFGQTVTNRYIGYLPDVPEFYGYMTTREYLKLCGEITGMSPSDIRVKSEELLEIVGLASEKKRIRGFSRGMKQRLGIAQALLNSPKLLICDEPTSALDPIGRKEVLDVISKIKERTTVVFSTHILSDVERICDDVVFINNGSVVMQGTLAEIKNAGKSSAVEVDCVSTEDADRLLAVRPDGKRADENRIIFENSGAKGMGDIMRSLIDNNIAASRVEMLEPSLEDLFVEVAAR
ncbi:MAG: ABC transporter ATP-binding protein [Clostridiales bacterium]|nr:ABC transporter ATP-binding protein [Clostridiales bacterium]